jgi:hypothetical protein
MKYTIICVNQYGLEEIEAADLSIDEAITQLRDLLVEEEEGESYLVRETVDEDIEEMEEEEEEEGEGEPELEEEEEEEYEEAS